MNLRCSLNFVNWLIRLHVSWAFSEKNNEPVPFPVYTWLIWSRKGILQELHTKFMSEKTGLQADEFSSLPVGFCFFFFFLVEEYTPPPLEFWQRN